MTSQNNTDVKDLIIIGGGPAGTKAAFAAAERGLDVLLIEKENLGGTCLHRGCIPTKFLLGGTRAGSDFEIQSGFRSVSGSVEFDLAALQRRKDRLLNGSAKAVGQALEKAGVEVLLGTGKPLSVGSLADNIPAEVEITSESGTNTRSGRMLILAAGSKPMIFPGLEPDGETVLTSDHILSRTEPIKELLVIGGGAVGLEIGEIFRRLGAKLTVVEAADRLMPWEEPEVGAALAAVFKRKKVAVHTKTMVEGITRSEAGATVRLSTGQEITAEKVLLAVGRKPAPEGLGLDALGIAADDRGRPELDETLRAADTTFIVGDLNGRVLLAHAAEHQAEYAARTAADILAADTRTSGQPAAYTPPHVPFCLYGGFETLRVGPTSQELRDQGADVSVTESALAENPVAHAKGLIQGFVRILWVQGRVVSISAAGAGVTSLSTAASVITAQGWTRDDSEQIMFAHPTLDETLMRALKAEPQPL